VGIGDGGLGVGLRVFAGNRKFVSHGAGLYPDA
jgi:hypothetical protein